MSKKESVVFADDQLEELETIKQFDPSGEATISKDDLTAAFKALGLNLPGHEVRHLTETELKVVNGRCSFDNFLTVATKLRSQRDLGRQFVKKVKPTENIERYENEEAGRSGALHSATYAEQRAFADWINTCLSADKSLSRYLPLKDGGADLYSKVEDGILLCKLINASEPGTIDMRAVNKGDNMHVVKKHENLNLAINSAQSIGCVTTNISTTILMEGRPHIVLGLVWQIIRLGLLNKINLKEHPNLWLLLKPDESPEDLMKISPEELLLRWVNYHLQRAGVDRRIANFTDDIKDSVAYTHLLQQVAPREKGVSLRPLQEKDLISRATAMLHEADKIDCRRFVRPEDVCNGNQKLNLAFVANLFNNYPGLVTDEPAPVIEVIEETREEKTFRNWMNSLGVSPYVNHLYTDLRSGLIIFQLYDYIKPGLVNWTKVHKVFSKLRENFQKLENANYAVELGKQLKFSLVGIQGSDICDGVVTLTLALVWQLMRAYTLAVLSQLTDSNKPVGEREIIDWANHKLKLAGKTSSFTSFQDSALNDGRIVLDVVDALQPGSVDYSVLRSDDRLSNASYAISMARKIGAKVYALPEDIVELKSKMILTIFACLMIKDYQPKPKSIGQQ